MSHMKEHVNVKYKSVVLLFIAELNNGTKSFTKLMLMVIKNFNVPSSFRSS